MTLDPRDFILQVLDLLVFLQSSDNMSSNTSLQARSTSWFSLSQQKDLIEKFLFPCRDPSVRLSSLE